MIVASSAAPIRDKDGKIIGVVMVIRDVTERRRIEQELVKAQKLESLGLLAGGIAHDFNNLFAGIFGSVELAQVYAGSNENLRNILSRTLSVSGKAKGLTRQLLTLSKGGAPSKTLTHIRDIVSESVLFALSGSNVKCGFSMPQDLWACNVDIVQIQQVLDNIVINAKQAMPDGGRMEVKAENIVISRGMPIPLPEGNYVKILVSDYGCGIQKKDLPKIFDPFFTTKQEGTGLGLTIAYSIVKRHGGLLDVESEAGKGTCVRMYLPAAAEKFVAEEPVAEAPACPGKAGKILVMDDEPEIRELIEQMLQTQGHAVVLAENGSKAIELFLKAKASSQPFDAVILDLTIPDGMGGKDTLNALFKIDPDVKAVVISGYSNDPVMADPGSYGFKGALLKPFSMKELAEVMKRLIRQAD